jgi:hypothetical protein
LCVCSISKMCRMSRTILELEEDRFGYANGPPPKGFSPLQRSTNSCASLEALPPPFRQGVFFLTHPLPACRAHFTPGPSRPPEPAGPFRGRRKEKKPRLNIHDHIVYIGFILRVRRPFRRRTGSKRSSKPVVGMVIAVIVTFSARLCLRRGGKIGA